MEPNYSNTSMLDILFENRNKSYGAYVLRRDHNEPVVRAMLITFSAVFLLLFSNFLAEKFKTVHKIIDGGDVVVQTKEIQPTITTPKPKPEPKPIQQKAEARATPTVANTEPRIVAQNNSPTDSMPSPQDFEKYESGLTNNTTAALGMGVGNGTGTASTLEGSSSKETAASSEIIDWTEDMPEFPGGERKLKEFLAHNTVFPDKERELGIEGKAFIRFVVNEDGSVTNAEVLKTDSKGFGRSALQVVSMLPKFKPGKQGGKPVKVHYVLPFTFHVN